MNEHIQISNWIYSNRWRNISKMMMLNQCLSLCVCYYLPIFGSYPHIIWMQIKVKHTQYYTQSGFLKKTNVSSKTQRYTLRLTWTTSIWKATMREIRQWHYFWVCHLFVAVFIYFVSRIRFTSRTCLKYRQLKFKMKKTKKKLVKKGVLLKMCI